MNPTQAKQLIARHPTLLSMPRKSAIAHRGIECGNVWYAIIDQMLAAMVHHCADVGSSTMIIV